MRVLLQGGPAHGRALELDVLTSPEVEIEVDRTVHLGLTESVGGSTPVFSGYRKRTTERHRYRLVRRDPPVMEWTGKVEE